MKYRPEIDGLRALAVVPVILFHAGFEMFSGGFVGVDVFFVISGYLITTIIIEDIANKRFNIVNFYERRARRILPALYFVLLVSIVCAYFLLEAYDLNAFLKSVTATVFFVSNFYFWRNNGYFDPASEETPLLHTWSLAVEEQYYLFFPIFLILVWRFGKNRMFWIIIVMATISLLLSEWGWRNKATANFYLAPTRAWELFAGSIAAFIVQKQGVQKNNFFSLLGLIAIVFSIFIYDSSTPFPSVYALVPIIGVVFLIIYADSKTLAAKVLSTKLFVGLGLISYSAYLWHQPIIAFQYYRFQDVNEYITILAVGFFSYLTWILLEKPVRKSKKRLDLFLILISAVALLSLSLFLQNNDVDVDDINYQERNFDRALLDFGSQCQVGQSDPVRCISSHSNALKPDIVLLGDSHAEHLFPGLSTSASELNIVSLTTSGAPLLENLERSGVFEYLSNVNSSSILVVYSMHYLGMLTALPVGSSYELEVGKVLQRLEELDIEVVLVSDVPRYATHPRRCRASLSLRGSIKQCQKSRAMHDLESYQYITDLRSLSVNFGIPMVNIDEEICNETICSMVRNNNFLFRDTNHLTVFGSIVVSKPIITFVEAILNQP